MNTCFHCGRPIPKGEPVRRQLVRTGEDRVRPLTSERELRVRATYGKRIVCRRCSEFVAIQELKREIREWMGLGVAVALLVVLLVLTGFVGR